MTLRSVTAMGLAMAVVAACGCQDQKKDARNSADRAAALQESLAVDVSALKSADNQPLIIIDASPLKAPPRPADGSKLPEDDPLHWYDMEYAGWNCTKANLPKSPADGAKDKYVM